MDMNHISATLTLALRRFAGVKFKVLGRPVSTWAAPFGAAMETETRFAEGEDERIRAVTGRGRATEVRDPPKRP
jgi:hypothetical protein